MKPVQNNIRTDVWNQVYDQIVGRDWVRWKKIDDQVYDRVDIHIKTQVRWFIIQQVEHII